MDTPFKTLGIAGTGMAAQRERLNVIAQNIAHAQDTNRGDGTPWRRKLVAFEAVLSGETEGGVRLAGVREDDKTEMPKVRLPGHPDADKDGWVVMPNVNPVFEMVELLSASRAYEANLQVARSFRTMVEQALTLGR